jgi:hypothetical protein
MSFFLDAGKLIVRATGLGGNIIADALERSEHIISGDANYDIIKMGPQLSGVRDLRPGDILVKQGTWFSSVDEISKTWQTAVIGAGQMVLNRSNHKYIGAGLLGHAAIYIGDSKIIEAVAKGVVTNWIDRENKLAETDYRHYNWYVIRPKHADVAEAALAAAKECVTSLDPAES